MDFLAGKVILITGGTGSFGTGLVRHFLKHHQPKLVRVYSRDEYKQVMLQQHFKDPRLECFLGDIRDRSRLRQACQGVHILLHAAALKQVPVCEAHPSEAIRTNILGAMNVVDVAVELAVERVLNISSDKAVNPANLYGATKLCAEKLFLQHRPGKHGSATKMASLRYGNLIGSRGSVLPLFLEQQKNNHLTLTDRAMTRFWITTQAAVAFLVSCLEKMKGGEIFVPKIPSMALGDLAEAIAPGATIGEMGGRSGEKCHETLISEQEGLRTRIEKDTYVILQSANQRNGTEQVGKAAPPGFEYRSDKNDQWLTRADIQTIIDHYRKGSS